jgi:hypothetical protein
MYRLRTALILMTLILHSLSASAAVLTKVKGDQVLIDLQGDTEYAEGSRYLVMVGDKKKAVVEITKIKGTKALGKVLKGTAQEQGTLAPLSGGAAAPSADAAAPSPRPEHREPRTSRAHRSSRHGTAFTTISYGVMLGYGLASQSVNATKSGVTETVSMTGSSLSLKGFADLPISGPFGAIGRAGFENFGVAGTSNALGAVETKILYLDADLLFRYNFDIGKIHPFPLLGLGVHYPISKTSGVLDISRISVTTIFFLGGGINYSLSDTMYIHAVAEYGLFPPSNDVKTSLIAIRGGVGFVF